MSKKDQSLLLSRRDLLSATAKLGALSLLGPLEILSASRTSEAQVQQVSERIRSRLSWLANRDVQLEGRFPVARIDGAIPRNLRGTLFRNGPGQKINNGVALKHLFDGDAYLTAFEFSNDGMTTLSQFIRTRQRSMEKRKGRMIYHDFGTPAPPDTPFDFGHSYKIPPNISVLPWDNRLLTFSEGGPPVAVKPDTLASQGPWNFYETLSTVLTGFTGHPKIDPLSGDGYGFAIKIRRHILLEVFRMDKASGRLIRLYSYPLGGFFMTHDMMITKNYIVFMICPLEASVKGLMLGQEPVSELLQFHKDQPSRILVFRKDGRGEPVEVINDKSAFVFHHCNAYEDEASGHLIFHSCLYENGDSLSGLASWGQEQTLPAPNGSLTRFEIDLGKQRLISQRNIFEGGVREFPCVDPRAIGSENRYLHLLEAGNEFLVFDTLVCRDMKLGTETKIQAPEGHALGEPIFVPDEDSEGWILHLGYDRYADETYLDIRKAVSLELIARVHSGRYIPLGFHGSFSRGQ